MKFPPARQAQDERLLGADDVSALPCTSMAREIAEDVVKRAGPGWAVDLTGETVTQSDEFGFVYRYRVTTDFVENGKKYSHEYIHVFWSKDCKSMGMVSFPTLELNLPRRTEGR